MVPLFLGRELFSMGRCRTPAFPAQAKLPPIRRSQRGAAQWPLTQFSLTRPGAILFNRLQNILAPMSPTSTCEVDICMYIICVYVYIILYIYNKERERERAGRTYIYRYMHIWSKVFLWQTQTSLWHRMEIGFITRCSSFLPASANSHPLVFPLNRKPAMFRSFALEKNNLFSKYVTPKSSIFIGWFIN